MSSALIAILLLFVAMMAGVFYVCQRVRRRANATAHLSPDFAHDEAEDNRVAIMIFGAILAGACLAIAAALLLFFLPQ
jgi:type VI protein secretion system component VasF